jgi:hypothetical protein
VQPRYRRRVLCQIIEREARQSGGIRHHRRKCDREEENNPQKAPAFDVAHLRSPLFDM